MQPRKWQPSEVEVGDEAAEAAVVVAVAVANEAPPTTVPDPPQDPSTRVLSILTFLRVSGGGAACTSGGVDPLISVRSLLHVRGRIFSPPSLLKTNEGPASSARKMNQSK